MAVVRDAELLYMVVRRGHGSCSRKYHTRQHNLTENQVMPTFLFSLPTTQVCMSLVCLQLPVLEGSASPREPDLVLPLPYMETQYLHKQKDLKGAHCQGDVGPWHAGCHDTKSALVILVIFVFWERSFKTHSKMLHSILSSLLFSSSGFQLKAGQNRCWPDSREFP